MLLKSSKKPSVFSFSHREPGRGGKLSDAPESPRRSITHQFIKARMALIAGGYEGRRGPHAHAHQRVDNKRPQRESTALTVSLWTGGSFSFTRREPLNGLKSRPHISSSAFSED